MTTSKPPREAFRLAEPGLPTLSVRMRRAGAANSRVTASGDVLYVHGATFGADLSIFHRFDRRSWADALNDAGFTVWGFDFAGYGASDRDSRHGDRPAGRIDDVAPQLHRVVTAIRARSGGRPVAIVAHSWGGSVAARYAGIYPQSVKALVLFAPIVVRSPIPRAPETERHDPPGLKPSRSQSSASHYRVTLLAQYRRFIEDVPRGAAQVLDEAHFLAWGAEYLATDPGASQHVPPSVATPSGPIADIEALWSGYALYDPALVTAPTLVVRGEWDSVCNDADADCLLDRLGSVDKIDAKITRGTHLLHLETQRAVLHNRVNAFLERAMR